MAVEGGRITTNQDPSTGFTININGEIPMHILSIRPASPGGGKLIARFDLEMPDGVRLYDLKLVRGSTGPRVYGPALHGGAAVTFPITIADEIAREAVAHVRHAA